ncbi:MAG TPA: gluconate 2-dehydrogenase subunit 3 family protein [Gaiellaceae bacterium]|nr:gluconate 2-dehydrogenase subunit 3 family protein [Gaiellaceae bacterium]
MGTDQAHPNPHGLRQRKGTTPQLAGRYPDWNVLDEQEHWDETTRRVVLSRLHDVPELTFFDEREAATLTAFCDVLLAQDEEPRIPVLAYIDEKLAGGVGDGWQYYDLPGDGEVWRIVARGLDDEAQRNAFDSFADASLELQASIVHRFGQGELHGRAWESVNVARAFKVVIRYACQAFYSHPWAWTEIGFGGPAYPRGYGAFGAPHMGERESWEGEESFHVDPVKDTQERGIE